MYTNVEYVEYDSLDSNLERVPDGHLHASRS